MIVLRLLKKNQVCLPLPLRQEQEKTLAFALTHAQKKRIIIVLPFISIIEQNAEIYGKICGNILEDHSLSKYDEESKLFSERWSSPVIVTTSIKFFETLFKHKPADLRRLHSITDSVIIFDEAQSLPPHLLGVTLDSINGLCSRYGCLVVFFYGNAALI